MTRPLFLALLPLLAACATPEQPPSAVDAPTPYTLADLRIPEAQTAMPRERRGPEKRPTRGQSRDAVSKANAAALELPALPCFVGKACEYWYQPDRHFLVHMGVLNQTLVCLRPGEVIRDIVAPGAQVWIPHQPYSHGSGRARTECIAFMPRRAGLDHQISVFTDQRKYDLNVMTWARSHHVEVRWRYPEDVLAALNRTRADADPDAGGDRSAGLLIAASAAIDLGTAALSGGGSLIGGLLGRSLESPLDRAARDLLERAPVITLEAGEPVVVILRGALRGE